MDKTLRDFHKEVEKEYLEGEINYKYAKNPVDETAERYACYKAEQACIKQKKICAAHAEVRRDYRIMIEHNCNDTIRKILIDKDSIRNAPLATQTS